MGVLLVVNLLTAFNVTRGFCLIFGGEAKPMTTRSPEGLWALVLPMVITVGFALHMSLILKQGNLLPNFADIDWDLSSVLVLSSLLGVGSSAFVYLNPKIAKPLNLPLPTVQRGFADDLCTD